MKGLANEPMRSLAHKHQLFQLSSHPGTHRCMVVMQEASVIKLHHCSLSLATQTSVEVLQAIQSTGKPFAKHVICGAYNGV